MIVASKIESLASSYELIQLTKRCHIASIDATRNDWQSSQSGVRTRVRAVQVLLSYERRPYNLQIPIFFPGFKASKKPGFGFNVTLHLRQNE
jgi:hypothetical protein